MVFYPKTKDLKILLIPPTMKKQLRTLTKLLAAVIACCLSVAVHAQTTVRGTVTDADGMPLVGATVIVITGTQPGGGYHDRCKR